MLRNEVLEDRQLTLDDMQGMFLLFGIGIVFASIALLHEIWNGYKCYNEIKTTAIHRTSIPSIILTSCTNNNEENKIFYKRFSVFYKRALSGNVFGNIKNSCETTRPFSH